MASIYDKINTMTDKELYNLTINYPLPEDSNLQSKLFTSKELYNYRIKHKPELKNYYELKKYRDLNCSNKNITLANQQIMLSKFFNVNSIQSGLLLFHGLGTGKTCSAITIAETFKNQITQYNTKILILVPGPTIKQNWISQIEKCTNNIYKNNNTDSFMDYFEYYKIMSFKSFNKRVLGERIKNYDTTIKHKYQKNDKGEYLRKDIYDKIENLNNTLIIVDEAHNITGNTTYESLKKIINNSVNLKILLLTGTPMKNIATDIIDLINLLKPANKQIKQSDIFIIDQETDTLSFAPNGKEKLKNAVKGYISYYKGGDPYIFAIQHDIGEISPHLKFTKIIPCKMSKFHYDLYLTTVENSINKLEQTTNSVVNFVLPLLKDNKIIATYGNNNLKQIINILKHSEVEYNKALYLFLKQTSGINDIPQKKLIYLTKDNDITGQFLHENFLYIFSIKFAQALKNINELVYNKRGVKTAFIYSNLVIFGINLFKQVLLQNGYLEFKENTKKTMEYIPEYTRCYYCGIQYNNHNNLPKNIPQHEFYPACFISITGSDNQEEDIEDDTKKILDSVFSSSENSNGKYIKFVLGSRVLSEGFNLKNVGEVHILDTWFNFARTEQVIGRGIRRCSHIDTITEDNPYPVVNVYKYCVVIDKKTPSTEELIYKRAEKKHVLIKEIEHIIKENSIDCALNYEANKINNHKYDKCIPITTKNYDNIELKDNDILCPVECDYQKCNLKCSDPNLAEFYDESTDSYTVPENKLNDNVYVSNISSELIRYKQKIKNLYILKYVYDLDELLEAFNHDFDNFELLYFYKALDEFIPQDENEFNNYTDVLIDKYNRPGYLIYINKYYIFQPFGLSEKETMNYRTKYFFTLESDITLYEYMNHNNLINKINSNSENKYDFDTYYSYYANKKEFKYVGIIDKEPNKKKIKNVNDLKDVFRLRKNIVKKSDKKREAGLQSYIGSVCFNSYNLEYISKVFKKLNLKFDKSLSRSELCEQVQKKLYELEKYSNDGYTYLIIPCNHPTIPFPLNLKDRVEFIKNKIKNNFKSDIIINVTKTKVNNLPVYNMVVKKNKTLQENKSFFIDLGFTETNTSFNKTID